MADWGDWDDWKTGSSDQDWEWDTGHSGKKSGQKQQAASGKPSADGWDTGSAGGWPDDDTARHKYADSAPIHTTTSAPSRQSRGGVSGLNPSKDVFVGIAQNVQSMPERERNFFSAWLDSLIYGVPFVNGRVRNVFNLQLLDVEDSMSITQQRSIAVTFFGEANTGLIGRGQTLQVKGRFGADRTVYASEIVNLTNGSLISIHSGVPGNVIRVITLVLVLAIASFFFSVPLPGLGNINILQRINWQGILVYAILILLAIWWILNQLRHPSRTTVRVVGALVLLLMVYLVPSVGIPILVILLMCYGLYLIIRNTFR